ncbi:wee1-like protein kinase-like [Planoprotostelium fungivorum]|uniref:Wee1-like protein kinase-like n=1 Tax=Planoprotostelium fungivorum TaxID=1890364 RepID=A0A2P6N9J4_9EUKA|nr:wee1-like protein kinase-like [Planoprotostelium fungivorum]
MEEQAAAAPKETSLNTILNTFPLEPIGIFRSCFPEKNGTPRQGSLCKHTQGKLQVTYGNNNAEHFVDGLSSFSHAHLIFLFHQNSLNTSRVKAKIEPPRLNGAKVGVFATRSPHRPNPIGLTIAKIERVEGDTVYFSGVDLVDGTPVLDIKPYVPIYDSVPSAQTPEWILSPPVSPLEIEYTSEALQQLQEVCDKKVLEFYKNPEELKEAITEVLTLDPRSVEWKRKLKKGVMSHYGFCIDVLNIVCGFDGDAPSHAKIMRVEDWSTRYGHGKKPKDYHAKPLRLKKPKEGGEKRRREEEAKTEEHKNKESKCQRTEAYFCHNCLSASQNYKTTLAQMHHAQDIHRHRQNGVTKEDKGILSDRKVCDCVAAKENIDSTGPLQHLGEKRSIDTREMNDSTKRAIGRRLFSGNAIDINAPRTRVPVSERMLKPLTPISSVVPHPFTETPTDTLPVPPTFFFSGVSTPFSPKKKTTKACPPSPSPKKTLTSLSGNRRVRSGDEFSDSDPPKPDLSYVQTSSSLKVPEKANDNPFSPRKPPTKRAKIEDASISPLIPTVEVHEHLPTSSRYTLDFVEIEQIGDGSFGKVYRCTNRIDGVEYAIKTFKKEIMSDSHKKNMLKEVYALAAVAHPNLIRYYCAWVEDERRLYIQTEYCNGGTLSDLKQKREDANEKITPEEIIDIIRQLCGGIKHMHAKNMVHLDIKPCNIYLQKDEGSNSVQYKLGDFGLADCANKLNSIEEGDGRYLPKELLNMSDNHALSRADIFSLGISIYELTRKEVLPGNGQQWTDIREGKFDIDLPQELAELIKNMMHPVPQQRPTAEDILNSPIIRTRQETQDSELKQRLASMTERVALLEQVLREKGIDVPN